MNGGVHGAPWWARLGMVVIAQIALGGTQFLLYLQEAGMWATLGVAGMQLLAATVGAYGPQSAGGLVRNVGKAVRDGKENRTADVLPDEGPK